MGRRFNIRIHHHHSRTDYVLATSSDLIQHKSLEQSKAKWCQVPSWIRREPPKFMDFSGQLRIFPVSCDSWRWRDLCTPYRLSRWRLGRWKVASLWLDLFGSEKANMKSMYSQEFWQLQWDDLPRMKKNHLEPRNRWFYTQVDHIFILIILPKKKKNMILADSQCTYKPLLKKVNWQAPSSKHGININHFALIKLKLFGSCISVSLSKTFGIYPDIPWHRKIPSDIRLELRRSSQKLRRKRAASKAVWRFFWLAGFWGTPFWTERMVKPEETWKNHEESGNLGESWWPLFFFHLLGSMFDLF